MILHLSDECKAFIAESDIKLGAKLVGTFSDGSSIVISDKVVAGRYDAIKRIYDLTLESGRTIKIS